MSAIDWAAIDALDDQLDNQFDGVSLAALKAVIAVESSGNGYNKDGSVKILVEGHRAWKILRKQGKDPAQLARGYEDVLYPKWTKEHYIGGAGEHDRLERLTQCAGEEVAMLATSWGLGQVMGENYAACGYADVRSYVQAVRDSPEKQVEAMLQFIRSKRLWQYLVGDAPDFARFAEGYNGSGYRENQYDAKMWREFRKFSQSPQQDFKSPLQSRRIQGAGLMGAGEVIKQAADVIAASTQVTDPAAQLLENSASTAQTVLHLWQNATAMHWLGWLVFAVGALTIAWSWYDDRQKGRT